MAFQKPNLQNKSLPEIIIIVLIIGIIILFITEGPTTNTPQINNFSANTLSIASWNLQIFGKSKMENNETKQIIESNIQLFDIIIIQEIRDETGTAFQMLCADLQEYSCNITNRAGRTDSKEQYGIIYKKGINLIGTNDYSINPQNYQYWERPPARMQFGLTNYTFIIYTIHTKPDDVRMELDNLHTITSQESANTIIIGDLNADGAYYDETDKGTFTEWHWIIPDDADTTTGTTNEAYDRIIMNDNAYKEYLTYGIISINTSVSDHNLIWTRIKTEEG